MRRPATSERRFSGRDGFTLIEALVAFTILALLTVTLQQSVHVTLGGMTRAERTMKAEMVARTLMSAPLTAADVEEVRSTGTLDGLAWSRTLTPLGGSTTAETGSDIWLPVRTRIEIGALAVETVRLVRMVGDR